MSHLLLLTIFKKIYDHSDQVDTIWNCDTKFEIKLGQFKQIKFTYFATKVRVAPS